MQRFVSSMASVDVDLPSENWWNTSSSSMTSVEVTLRNGSAAGTLNWNFKFPDLVATCLIVQLFSCWGTAVQNGCQELARCIAPE